MTLTNDNELRELEERERTVSRERQLLHQQIDRVYLSAPLTDEDIAELDELEQREQEVSSLRRRLHVQIDKRRLELGMPTWQEGRQVEATV